MEVREVNKLTLANSWEAKALAELSLDKTVTMKATTTLMDIPLTFRAQAAPTSASPSTGMARHTTIQTMPKKTCLTSSLKILRRASPTMISTT